MFNLSGSEIIFILLLALVVLGPEKLPDAIRKFGKTYGEVKKVSHGFQSELRSALDEPMREMRETADLARKAALFPLEDDAPAQRSTPSSQTPEASPGDTGDTGGTDDTDGAAGDRTTGG